MSATVFPPKNTAYTLTGVIKSAVTGNPLTGGLTVLAATVSIDGGAFASTTNAPVEIGTTGTFTLVLTATEMNGTTIAILVTATNANAIYYWVPIVTGGLAEIATVVPTTSSVAASVWNTLDYGDAAGRATNTGGQLAQVWRYYFNRQSTDKLAMTQTVYQDNSTTVLVSGSLTSNSQITTKGKMT